MRTTLTLGLLFVTGCGWSACWLADESSVDASRLAGGYAPQQARELLDAAAAAYADCASYRDEGLVSTTFIDEDGERVVEKPFRTAFVRADRFRFECRERDGDGETTERIVWSDDDGTYTWVAHEADVRRERSLSAGVAAATGVSSSSAHVVPRLLMPEDIGGFALSELQDVEMLGEEEIGGALTSKLQGKRECRGWWTLWIEKDSLLLRRLDRQSEFDTFRTRTTITYEPQINVPIDEEELDFDYPESE